MRRVAIALALILQTAAINPVQAAPEGELSADIAAQDAKVFGAYNRCDLDGFAAFFSPTVEFYHDTGGATFDRKTVVANTRTYICHKVRRELIDASLRIYPVKGFGAIEEGEHRFCELSTGKCEGIAKFVIVWKRVRKGWQITRVLSYGHRALGASE